MLSDLADSPLFLDGTAASLSRALRAVPAADVSPSRKVVREVLLLTEDAPAVDPLVAAFLPPVVADDEVLLLGVALRLSRLATISSRKSKTACGSSALSPGVAVVAADGATLLDDSVPAFDVDAAASLLGLPDPSNESRLSRNCSTSSLCEREPAVLAEGVPGRDIEML